MLQEYKEQHPEIDWALNEPYAIVETETEEVERIGVMSKNRLRQMGWKEEELK